jgi:hypothetical protein
VYMDPEKGRTLTKILKIKEYTVMKILKYNQCRGRE